VGKSLFFQYYWSLVVSRLHVKMYGHDLGTEISREVCVTLNNATMLIERTVVLHY
jgi:hypothetical protein